jgi:uroporphyrinogen decarboxylase
VQQTFPPPSLAQQFTKLESYLRAVRGSGVGVYASFSSFFDNVLRVVGEDGLQAALADSRSTVEDLMDMVVKHQERVMRAICDRFGADLSFVSIRDDLFSWQGLNIDAELLSEIALPRMKRLTAPAKEHGLLVALDAIGPVETALSALYEAGFNIIQSVDPEMNNLPAMKEEWQGRLAFVGGISTQLLVNDTPQAIDARVREICDSLAPGGGFVLGSSAGVPEDVLPQNYVTMIQAAQKYGYSG